MNSPSRRPIGRGRYIATLFNIGDLLILNVAFGIIVWLFPEFSQAKPYMREIWLLLNVSFLPAIAITYRNRHERRAILMEHVARVTFTSVGLHALIFLSLLSFLRLPMMALRVVLSFYALLLVLLLLFRILGNYILKSYRRQGFNFTRVVIIGTGEVARRLYREMERDAGFGYSILGFFDDDPKPGFTGKYLGSIDMLEEFIASNNVRQIFYCISGQSESLSRVTKVADDHVVDFYYVPQIPKVLLRRFELHNIGAMPVMSIRRNPLKNSLNRFLKRSFDIVFSSVFLLFYPLIYIPVAICIKLTSPGPVYFKQERTGYLGKSFKCLKFRTMKVNANSDKTQATKDDPRKTRFGDFLRKTSLDELPQFINVWRGDMSIVGPRPHMLKHTEDYTALVDRYMVRHAVKPGITGWAQVNGFRGLTDELWKMERRVEHDVWYIENWTFLLDLKIVVRTVINAIQGEKNAF